MERVGEKNNERSTEIPENEIIKNEKRNGKNETASMRLQ
jgi:hypothetical protein